MRMGSPVRRGRREREVGEGSAAGSQVGEGGAPCRRLGREESRAAVAVRVREGEEMSSKP